jgi:cell division protein FtsQ
VDGERRFVGPLARAFARRARTVLFNRRRWASLLARGNRLSYRVMARAFALALLGGVVVEGLVDGGHLDYRGSPWLKVPGRVASVFGFAADDIRITGLEYHDAEAVLTPIGVRPGGSLIGFDASNARRLLENMDWIASAKVLRMFPNQLEISLVERKPIAIWQRDGRHYVIDASGAAMSTLNPRRFSHLPMVTGEGAQHRIDDLVNLVEAHPWLKSQLLGAARVGDRRWTLVLDSGVSIALPENDAEHALRRLEALDSKIGLLSKGIRSVDLRLPDRITIRPLEVPEEKAAGNKALKLSRRE